jgi:DNA-binding NtrC family response regulator
MEEKTFPIGDNAPVSTLPLEKRPEVVDLPACPLRCEASRQDSTPRDVISLAKHFIKIAEEQIKTGPKELSKEAEEYLLNHDWQGRTDELENAVKRACILTDGMVLQIGDFDLRYRQIKSIGRFIEEKLKGFMRNIKNLEKFNLYDTVIPEVEKALILMVMKETKGNQTKAAKLLGINRNTLRDRIKKLKIKATP